MKKSIFTMLGFLSIALFLNAFTNKVYAQPWTQRGATILPEASSDYAGYAVGMNNDGSTIAILAPENSSYGQVRVYNWNGSSWVQKGPDLDGTDSCNYPESVSLSGDGNTVVMGGLPKSKVWSWNGNNWIQKGLDINFSGTWAPYSCLSSDGNTLLLGSHTDATAGPDAGALQVYRWDGNQWVLKGNQLNGLPGSRFGYAVDINNDGTVIMAGGPYPSSPDLGFARIYVWNGSAWLQRGSDILAEASNDYGGCSVAISDDGNTAAVGASFNDGAALDAGHVRVYTWTNNNWVQKGNDMDGEAVEDLSGVGLAMSADGNTIAIGAPGNNPVADDEGQIEVYTWNGNSWVQKGYDIEGTDYFGGFGLAISMSNDGNVVFSGAPGANNQSGLSKCYTFGNVGVVENNFAGDVKLYPNPGHQEFHISLSSVQKNITLSVTDMLGAEVYKNDYTSTDHIQFDLQGHSGYFFVKIQGEDNQQAVFKIQKL